MKAVVGLPLLAVALGAGIGYGGGYLRTAIDRVQTDTKIGCAVLQTAESAGYITRAQRSQLVDTVVPPRLPKAAEPRPAADWIKVFADSWWDAIREDQKSGCPDV
jgi:hypothetical protein